MCVGKLTDPDSTVSSVVRAEDRLAFFSSSVSACSLIGRVVAVGETEDLFIPEKSQEWDALKVQYILSIIRCNSNILQ